MQIKTRPLGWGGARGEGGGGRGAENAERGRISSVRSKIPCGYCTFTRIQKSYMVQSVRQNSPLVRSGNYPLQAPPSLTVAACVP